MNVELFYPISKQIACGHSSIVVSFQVHTLFLEVHPELEAFCPVLIKILG